MDPTGKETLLGEKCKAILFYLTANSPTHPHPRNLIWNPKNCWFGSMVLLFLSGGIFTFNSRFNELGGFVLQLHRSSGTHGWTLKMHHHRPTAVIPLVCGKVVTGWVGAESGNVSKGCIVRYSLPKYSMYVLFTL